MISGALNGPSSCLQYDEGTTKPLVGYLTSIDMHWRSLDGPICWPMYQIFNNLSIGQHQLK